MAEADDGGDDGPVFGAGVDLPHEGLVDLELVEGETLEVGEAGIAGAEVVDGDRDAQRLELIELPGDLLDVAHHHALGELEGQQAGGDVVAAQGRGDAVDEVGAAELQRRDIDRHRHQRQAGSAPGGELGAHRVEHPLAEAEDQAALLGDGYEAPRQQQAQLRVLPAHQGLGAHQAAVGGHQRLVVKHQLVAIEGAAQGVFEGQALAAHRVHARGEELDAVAARLLGPVHGHVGPVEEDLGVPPVVGVDRHADAGGQAELAAGQPEGFVEGRQQARGAGTQPGPVVALGDQHDELVAAVAQHALAGAQHRLEAPRDLDQQLVAHVVAEGVVDVLEAVEIEETQGQPTPQPVGQGGRLAHHGGQLGAGGQAGEEVVAGQEADARLVGLLLADVGKHRHVVGDLALVAAHHAQRQGRREGFAARPAEPHLALPGAGLGGLLADHRHEALGVVRGVEELEHRAPDALLGVAGERREGPVGHHHAALAVADDDALGVVLEDLGGEAQDILAAIAAQREGHVGGELLDQADRVLVEKVAFVLA